MVPDSIFSSYDQYRNKIFPLHLSNVPSTILERKKKKEGSISTTQRFIREFRSDPRRGTSTMSAQDIERESAGSLRKFMVPREIRLGVQ